MNSQPPLLQARDLACVRGEALLFDSLDFAVSAGEALQIEGANGSGKSSLLRILAGLGTTESGEVLWRGASISRNRAAYQAELAYLGHHPGLKADLTIQENLGMATALSSGAKACPKRQASALEAVGLLDRADLNVRVLSAGQRQRVCLARMALSGAPLWIMDEPFTALDTAGIGMALDMLEQHLQQGGLAVLTSHQPVPLKQGLNSITLT